MQSWLRPDRRLRSNFSRVREAIDRGFAQLESLEIDQRRETLERPGSNPGRAQVEGLELAPEVPVTALGGFVSLGAADAAQLQHRLRRGKISTDHRGDRLRLGPAPYVTEPQLRLAIDAAREAAARRA